MSEFVVARNPDGDSKLPYLLLVPIDTGGVILKARESWPRTAKVYCHRVKEWPDDAEILERVPVRSCVRRGAAIDLVLDRGRENRSQLVSRTSEEGARRSSGRRRERRSRPVPVWPFHRRELAAVPRAAVVVEDRYSAIFRLEHVRPSVVADGLAECMVGWPTVPIVFCETRKLAQEWTYRFLGAAAAAGEQEYAGELAVGELARAVPVAPPPPSAAAVRAWALAHGHRVSDRGRVPQHLVSAYRDAREGSGPGSVG